MHSLLYASHPIRHRFRTIDDGAFFQALRLDKTVLHDIAQGYLRPSQSAWVKEVFAIDANSTILSRTDVYDQMSIYVIPANDSRSNKAPSQALLFCPPPLVATRPPTTSMLVSFGLPGRFTGQALSCRSYVRTHVAAGLVHVQCAPTDHAMNLGCAV